MAKSSGTSVLLRLLIIGSMLPSSALALATPAAAQDDDPSPSVTPSIAADDTIEIDGGPVELVLGPREQVEKFFEYDGVGRVVLTLTCDVDAPWIYYSLSWPGFGGGNIVCDPSDEPSVFGPTTPLNSALGNRVLLTNNDDTRAVAFTISLSRVAHQPEGTFWIGDDPFDVEVPPTPPGGRGATNAKWYPFEAQAGMRITVEHTAGCSPSRVHLRFPDMTTRSISCSGPDQLPFPLPETGTYRLEFHASLVPVEVSGVRVVLTVLPDVCQEAEVAPIMLVHGFNGAPSDWSFYRIFLVGRIAREYTEAGVADSTVSLACAGSAVETAELGPRDNSDRNGFLLASQILDLRERAGGRNVDIIAHSKGGLDSRRAIQYLRAEGGAVRNLLMIATPNAGTPLADMACGLYGGTLFTGPAVGRWVEETFGPCDGPGDGLFAITESFVQGEFNWRVLNSSSVYHHTIAGASTCGVCRLLHVLMDENDSLVPVSSVEVYAPSLQHVPRGVFDADHGQLLENGQVLGRAHCSLIGRTPEPIDCEGEPEQVGPPAAVAAAEPTAQVGELTHFDLLEIPGEGSVTVPLPPSPEGATGVALMLDQADLSATAGGVEFEAGTADGIHTLTAELSGSATDLVVTNPHQADVEALLLVLGDEPGLAVTVTPVDAPGTPAEIRVAGQDAAQLVGAVGTPAGEPAELTFTTDGTDAVAQFVPADPGSYPVSVVRHGERRQVAFDVLHVSSGAGSVPGSYTETVEAGQDGLFDALHFDVDVSITEPGSYRLIGNLASPAGAEVARVETAAELAAGAQEVRLTVPGPVLYASGADGPYSVEFVLVRELADADEEVVVRGVAGPATQPHQVSDFRPAMIEPGVGQAEQQGETFVGTAPVTLSEPVTAPVTVEFASVNRPGEMHAQAPQDYVAVSGTLTFLPGQTEQIIAVTVHGNPDQQVDKLVVIEFTNPAGAALGGDGEAGLWILAPTGGDRGGG